MKREKEGEQQRREIEEEEEQMEEDRRGRKRGRVLLQGFQFAHIFITAEAAIAEIKKDCPELTVLISTPHQRAPLSLSFSFMPPSVNTASNSLCLYSLLTNIVYNTTLLCCLIVKF